MVAILCFLFTIALITPTDTTVPPLTKRIPFFFQIEKSKEGADEKPLTLNDLYADAQKQIDPTVQCSLSVLKSAHRHIEYWYTQKAHPVYYFIRKGPLKWFKGQWQTDEIHTHIKNLERIIHFYALHIGRLKQLEYTLSALKQFDHTIIADLIECLHALLHMQEPKGHTYNHAHSLEELHLMLKNNEQALMHSKNIEQTLIKPHAKPGHLTRNWIPYSATAILGLYSIYYYSKNQEWVDTFIKNTHTSTINFVQKHAIMPACDIINRFYGTNKKVQFDVKAIVNEVGDNVEKKIPTSFLRAMSQDVLEYSRQKAIIAGEHLEKVAREWDEKYNILFSMCLTIPALVAGNLAYRMSTRSIQWLLKKSYDPIQISMIELEVLINQAIHQESFDEYTHGYVYYWVYMLRKYRYLVPAQKHVTYDRDLAELESLEYSPQQKMNTITRMHRTYNFLSVA